MSKPEEIIPKIRKNTIVSMLKKGQRGDGRSPESVRNIKIETNVIEKAEGSAIVSLGSTMAIAGVKVNIGIPYSDSPDKGVQIVNAELIPLASPVFEPGPPGEDDVEISRVVDRAIRSSEAIDLSRLVLIPGRKVWCVYIDIYALNHDGNLFDAAMLAAMAALLTAKIPKVEVINDSLMFTDEKISLPMKNIPVTVTFAKIDDEIVVDPSYEEELVMDARITFGISKHGHVCAIQKGFRGGFTPDEILSTLKKAVEIATDVRKILTGVTGIKIDPQEV